MAFQRRAAALKVPIVTTKINGVDYIATGSDTPTGYKNFGFSKVSAQTIMTNTYADESAADFIEDFYQLVFGASPDVANFSAIVTLQP